VKKIILPSINELENIRNSIFESNDTTYVKEQIKKLAKYNSEILLNFKISGDYILWRGRGGKECDQYGFKNISQLHIPPTNLSKNPNRFNQYDKRILYTAFNYHTALAEINAQPGQYVHLISYKIKPNNELTTFVLGEYSKIHGKGKTESFNEKINTKIAKIYYQLIQDQNIEISLTYLDKLLSAIMNHRYPESYKDKYLHTNALIESVKENKPEINCIVYPSSAFNDGINIAIDGDAADNIIAPQETVVVKVKNKFNFNLYDIEIIGRSDKFSETGDIIWSS
jgi:hypothetical protein